MLYPAMRAPILVLLAAALVAGDADLLPGENLGPDLADGMLSQAPPTSDAAGGGTSEVLPTGGWRLVETSDGAHGNRESVWLAALPAAALQRLDAALARPSESPPTVFTVRAELSAVEPSRPVHAQLRLGLGAHAEQTVAMADLRRAGIGARRAIDAASVPSLRFAVAGTNGSRRATAGGLRISLRVDTGSTPWPLQLHRLALHEVSGPPPAGARRLAAIGGALPLALLAAAQADGWRLDAPDAAEACIVRGGIADGAQSQRLAAALDRGANVLIAIEEAGDPSAELAARLPVNAWSWKASNLRRGDSALRGDMPPFASLGELALDARFDLHLPYAPIESGLQRYLWSSMQRPLDSAPWQVLLSCTADGGLPALVAGRSGRGRILVFAGALDDRRLLASPGLPAFASALIATLRPTPSPHQATKTASLRLRLARHQPGRLSATIANPTTAPMEAQLAWRVRTWWNETLAAGTTTVLIPAGGESAVALPERDETLGSAAVRRSAEDEPWRRISLAVVGGERLDDVPVCREGSVAIDIEDDPTGYADLGTWAMPGELQALDGRTARRHVWRPGQRPLLNLRLRHALINLAPLAMASDRSWRENPSIGGLNDRSFSISSLRGRLPLQGAWSGRPAAEHTLRLAWEHPVLVAAYRLAGFGPYRRWQLSNPTVHAVTADGRVIAEQNAATFAVRRGVLSAWYESPLPPTTVRELELRIHKRDAAVNIEPRNAEGPANCSLAEWEVLGWPKERAPATLRATLVATVVELPGGSMRELLRQEVDLAGCSLLEVPLALPALTAAPLTRVAVRLEAGGSVLAAADWSALVVAEGGTELVRKESLRDRDRGLLCSPGWVQTVGFGVGMPAHTQGWGGDDDKVWAWTHEQMEEGAGNRPDPKRLLVSATRLSHYTNPYRDLPDGTYDWDLVSAAMLAGAKPKERLWLVGSDRWNGVPIHVTWGWGEFVAFDRHLRANGHPGLRGRSRAQLQREIGEELGDRWQRWQLTRYTEAMQRSQDAFRANGGDFTIETHGSFPQCGGELGAALARTHKGVGTDLFWELRNQDLLWSIGTRFGLVALNPDLESGAYGQWGWDNGEQNQFWFATSGAVEPARRQWYATYFAGRVDLRGSFRPYHMLGYGSQGSIGTRMGAADFDAFARTSAIVGRLRPEAPAACGVAVSWAAQERAMGQRLGAQGFGLYPASGGPDPEALVGHAWSRLAKAGLPLGWVTSTHGLAAWRGTAPLLCLDPARWDADELSQARRLADAGAVVVLVGEPGGGLAELMGAERADGLWRLSGGATRIDLAEGVPLINRGSLRWCPVAPGRLSEAVARRLTEAVLSAAGDPLRLPPGLAAFPCLSRGSLLLPLADLGDRDRLAEIRLRPQRLAPGLRPPYAALDLDRGVEVPLVADADGSLRLSLPVAASSGRLLMITGAP